MSGGGDNTTTTKADPWKGVQPYLKNLYSRSDAWSNRETPFYPDQTYAGLSQNQQGGLYGGLGYMQDQFAPQAQQLQGSLQAMIDSPQNLVDNPAVQRMMAANESAVTDTLQNKWLPQQRRAEVAATGGYGTDTNAALMRGQAKGMPPRPWPGQTLRRFPALTLTRSSRPATARAQCQGRCSSA